MSSLSLARATQLHLRIESGKPAIPNQLIVMECPLSCIVVMHGRLASNELFIKTPILQLASSFADGGWPRMCNCFVLSDV